MSDEKKGKRPVPAFIKPGDDPELDRLLAEAKRAGDEPGGLYYYDVFGRRKRLDRDGTSTTVKGKARMTRQSRVLALAVLGIVGPLLVMAMVAFLPPRRTGAEVGSHGEHGERGSAGGPSAMAVAVATEVLVATGPLLADGGAVVPKRREDMGDAGAAPVLTAAPSGAPTVPVPREPARPKAGKSSGGDPYEAAPVKTAKTVEVVAPPAPSPTPVLAPAPLPSTKPLASSPGPLGGPPQY